MATMEKSAPILFTSIYGRFVANRLRNELLCFPAGQKPHAGLPDMMNDAHYFQLAKVLFATRPVALSKWREFLLCRHAVLLGW